MTVHPHSRGEQRGRPASRLRPPGSSPLAWGTVSGETNDPIADRFIPTRVGNSLVGVQSTGESPVHPHSRGEQCPRRSGGSDVDGSSPLAWGTDSSSVGFILYHRFIPTRVGNRCGGTGRYRYVPVHPHSRGEQAVVSSLVTPLAGSSPLAWGTVCNKRWVREFDRFIPTRVGNRLGRA